MTDTAPSPASSWGNFKRIFSLTRSYRGWLAFAIFLSVLASLADLVIPLGLRELINAVFEDNDYQLLNLLSVGLFVLFLFQAIVGFWGGYLLRKVGERIIADLRTRLYTHLQRLGLTYYTNERIGDITSRLTNDVASVRRAATSVFSAILRQSLSLAGSITLMFMLNWRLTLVVLLVVPPSGLAARYFGKKVRTFSRRVQDTLADSTSIAEETLSAIRVVKAFAHGDVESKRYGDSVEDVYNAAKHLAFLTMLLTTVVGLAFYGALVAVFWFGGIEVLANRLTAGDLVAFIFYALAVSSSTKVLSQVYSSINSAVGASERIFELLDTEPEITDRPGAAPLPSSANGIAFENVAFAYEPDRPVLRDISFHVSPGETCALVGPSGAGKTTILQLIPRFFDTDAGCVRVGDHDIRDVTVDSLRRHIAIVSQDITLFNLSVRENIRYGRLGATDLEVEEAARMANAHEFIGEMTKGYDTLVGEKGVKLSGGQKQRISIARAVLCGAPILLLDEPTSSLDSKSETLVQRAFDRMSEDRTTIMVTHRLSSIQNADKILVIEDGRIAEEGSHEELMDINGLYEEMNALQFHTASSPDGRSSAVDLPADRLTEHAS